MKFVLILGAMALALALSVAVHIGAASVALAALALGTLILVAPRARRLALAGLALALFGLIAPAWAQTAAPPADTGILLTLVLPLVLTFGGILTPVIGSLIWARISPALDAFQKLSGVQIDAGHREALHSAIDTGLKLAFAKGAPALEATLAGHLAAGRVGEVSEWVTKSVPGAIAHLGVSREILDGLTTARLSDSLASAVAAPLALPGAILGGLSGLAGAVAPAAAPSCPVCGTTDPNAVCTRTDCPDAQPAAPAGS